MMDANSIDLKKALGQYVRITAVAHNAKAGAVVMTDQGDVIYIHGLREWEDRVIGMRVIVSGILRRGHVYPDVEIDDGAISQGLPGGQWFVELERYDVMEE